MKKIRLRKWFKITLEILLSIDLFIMILECDSNWLLFVKTVICSIIGLIILIPLKLYSNL